ncbi:peptidase inhibitor family I36 protein [Streptomyces exfoliatus]|uniref:peptidase inhibitor family I36 protein n=1 Tax=Streptomyces exfoliatus TaxID=1905 RepID=UPI0004C72625|nr:peptidase inhibitor family I36 protein [Streptomyces exfoliatus]
MKIRTVLAGVLAAASLSLALVVAGHSTAAPTPAAPAPTPEIRVKTAQGLDACPTAHLCLYEHAQYNASGPARIWLFGNNGAAEKVEYNLEGRQPDHKGRSAFNNTKLYTATLRSEWTIQESADIIALAPGEKLPSLNVTKEWGGRLASYSKTGQGTYVYNYEPQAVNLNDHVGSVFLDKAPRDARGQNHAAGHFLPAGHTAVVPAVPAVPVA